MKIIKDYQILDFKKEAGWSKELRLVTFPCDHLDEDEVLEELHTEIDGLLYYLGRESDFISNLIKGNINIVRIVDRGSRGGANDESVYQKLISPL